MDRFAQMIVAAARQAESDSGIDIAKEADRGSARRSRPGSAGSARSRTATRRCSTAGPDRVNPFSIPAIIPNMGAGWVSMELGTKGPLSLAVHRLRGVEHGDRRRARTRSGSAAPT